MEAMEFPAPSSAHPSADTASGPRRLLYLCLGWLFVALGVAGAVLPVLPTTPFLLVALWAFSRSSRRFHRWLYEHPLLGPPLQRWDRHRVIPVKVKAVAVTGMGTSLVGVSLFSAAPWYLLAGMAAVMGYGAWYVLSRPSKVG